MPSRTRPATMAARGSAQRPLRARDRRDRRSWLLSLRPVDMRRLLRGPHTARQALQVTFHTCRRALELRKVFFGQTVEPERAGLVTEFFSHWMNFLSWSPGHIPG